MRGDIAKELFFYFTFSHLSSLMFYFQTSKAKTCRNDNNSKGCKQRQVEVGWMKRTWVTCHGIATGVGISAWDGMTWAGKWTVEMFGGAWKDASRCLVEIDWGPIMWTAEYARDAVQDGLAWFGGVTYDGSTRLVGWIHEGIHFTSESAGNLYLHFFESK